MSQIVRGVVSCLLLFSGTATMAQTIEFPLQTPKFQETKEVAGIGSYHLIRNPEMVAVEAFDLDGELLANCEAEWPENRRVMTCEMAAGGLFRATWHEKHVDFEDLVTQEHFSLYFEPPPPRLANPLEPGEPPPEHGTWVLRGTKTWDEVERDWGKITPIFSHLLVEVEATLGPRGVFEER